MVSLQADEHGIPVVIEAGPDGRFVPVSADRWAQILAAGGICDCPQAIIPVEAKRMQNPFEMWDMFPQAKSA